MALLLKNDVLFAHKAMNLVAGISSNSRRVAGAILDHFNKRTGQCDPSVERLARMLGIDRATVLRATAELCDPKGANLFEKLSHGGYGNRACYLPNWQRFQEIVSDWDRRMKSGDAPEGQDPQPNPCRSDGTPADPPAGVVAELRPNTSQFCDLDGRKTATQTLRRNPSNKPFELNARAEAPQKPEAKHLPIASKGLRKRVFVKAEERRKNPFCQGRTNVPPHIAAMNAAERRVNVSLQALGISGHALVIEWMNQERQAAATMAELESKGGGLAYILEAMSHERATAGSH